MVGVLRWITAGESHGPALVAMLEGMVAGVEVTSEAISSELARRRLGYGRGARMKFEADKVTIIGGVRHGFTLGGPVAIEIGNTEWPKWETIMSADPVDPDLLADQARNAPLTRPRPGHADYSGMLKYGFNDARPVLAWPLEPSHGPSCVGYSVPRSFHTLFPSVLPSRTSDPCRRARISTRSTRARSAHSTRLQKSR